MSSDSPAAGPESALAFLAEEFRVGEVELRRIESADEARIEAVFRELQDVTVLLGPETPAEIAREAVSGQDLPPGGHARHERSFLVWREDRPIGFLSVYGGYPTSRSLYIGSLFLVPVAQRGGHGKALVDFLENAARAHGFCELRAAIGLRNWPALRFWHRCGFDRVTRVSGDETYGQGKFAVIELTRSWADGAEEMTSEED